MLRLRLELDTRDKAHGKEHRNHGRASVAEERQRDADNGGDADAHADVDEGLEGNGGADTHTDEHVIGPAGLEANAKAVHNDDYKSFTCQAIYHVKNLNTFRMVVANSSLKLCFDDH